MELDVLGCAGSQPGGGQACSGYVITSDGTRVLVDCGFGVATRLTGVLDPSALDGIVITHRHLDHCVDLLGLFRVLWSSDATVPVFAAAEVAEALEVMVKPHRRSDWDRVFPWTTVAGGDEWSVGSLGLATATGDHPVPTVSLRVTDRDGSVLAYSSDSGGGADLLVTATDADLLLCEATWQGSDDDRRGDGHLTAAGAGRVATSAGAGRLALTHLRSHLDPAVSVAEASAGFDGPVQVVRDGDRLST